jgi:uncharacterized protein YjdB
MNWPSVRIGSAVALASVLGAAGGWAQVAELQVFPASVTLAVGQREELLASAYSASGDYLSTVEFRWTQTAQSIVRIETDPASPPGVFYLVGVAPGTAELLLSAGDRSQAVSVTVSGAVIAAGEGVATILQVEPAEVKLFPLEQVQLQPRFVKDDGSLAAYSPLTWASIRPEVATVDQSGMVAALDMGRTIIEARTESGLSRRVLVEVTAADWVFEQSEYLLAPLESDTVRAIVPSQGDRLLDPRQFTAWRSTNPDVVAVSPVGEITGLSPGTAQVEADGFGRIQRATVRVHPTVEEIVVRPRPGEVLVPLGGTIAFRATALAADSTPVPEATLHWHIRDTTIAGFDADSLLVHGREIGSTALTMSSRGFADAVWTVSVAATGLVVAPQRLGIGLGDAASLAASFADTAGIPLAPARAVTWASSDPRVVRVSGDGALEPIGFGSAHIVVSTPWGVADTALVFVQGAVVVTSTRQGTADLFAFDPESPGRFNPVTSGPGDDLGAAFSPDGSRIAFASNRDGNFEIYVADADGGNATRLTTTAANETEPAWGPDGAWLAYQSDASGAPQIWSMGADGSGQRALTQGPANMEPAVAPDGSVIAFSTIRDGNYEIYLMAPDGSEQQNVSRNPGAHERVPGWIDAGTVAYVREEREGRSATWVVMGHPLDGFPQPLTQPTMVVNDFAISPDGATLVIASEAQGPSGRTIRTVYLVPVGGGSMTEVPRQDEHDQIVRPAFRR